MKLFTKWFFNKVDIYHKIWSHNMWNRLFWKLKWFIKLHFWVRKYFGCIICWFHVCKSDFNDFYAPKLHSLFITTKNNTCFSEMLVYSMLIYLSKYLQDADTVMIR